MIDPKNRPNHSYVGAGGLNEEEKKLFETLVTDVKASGLSFESVNTVLIVISDALYRKAVTSRMDYLKQDDHADTSKSHHD